MFSTRTANDTPTPGQWASLTTVPEKAAAFANDLYFREGWADLTDIFGEKTLDVLRQTALLNFKPDGVVGHRLRPALDFVTARGFTPTDGRRLWFTRHSARELWRYNWNFYTNDRLAMSTLLYTSAEMLMVLLRGTAGDGVPASVRLSGLKGSADPQKRHPGQLRTALAPPNSIINFVHVADEPADIVREIAIFLDRAQRRELFAAMTHADPQQAAAALDRDITGLEVEYPAHDFDPARSVERLLHSGTLSADGARRLHDVMAADGRLSWEDLITLVSPSSLQASVWDFISVCTAVLVQERSAPDLLRDSTVAEWTARRTAGTA
jgi:nucleoside diphosphate kinase